MTQLIQQDQIQWGCVAVLLDNKKFRHAFAWGRRFYFEDSNGEYPGRARNLTVADITDALLIRDEAGHLHFENDRIVHPFETLGTFLGYMSGPILPETPEEQQARLKDAQEIIVIEETTEQPIPVR